MEERELDRSMHGTFAHDIPIYPSAALSPYIRRDLGGMHHIHRHLHWLGTCILHT